MASKKSPPPESTTTVLALTDDLLREVFLRLPSLPSLARAAFSCRAFIRAVRSSPAFRRNFLSLHPPPLLGVFLNHDGPTMPSFVPIRRADRELAALIRGGDFFFTRLPDEDPSSPGWAITDCRDGNLLLVSGDTGESAVYNPLVGDLDITPLPPDELFEQDALQLQGDHVSYYLDCCLLSSQDGGGGGGPRLFYTWHGPSRLRSAVFSCDTRQWQMFPSSEPVTPRFTDGIRRWPKVKGGTMVNGSVYWLHAHDAYMLVLNTATQAFTEMRVPELLEGRGNKYMLGETKDGELCIVCPIGFTLFVWVWRSADDADAGGVEGWLFRESFDLDRIVEVTKGTLEEHRELNLVAIIDGVVYFCTCETFYDPLSPAYSLSLCMETGELEKLFQKKLELDMHPYVMAWPRALVHNNTVRPQVGGA